ncbi:MAG: DUF4184 family protein [Candidatus Nanopelagicales bacterium]|nr:DUF4184 family protein [Candidatus Nanopelagicales bacterium]MDZ4248470.1 DUF4184 family protein [Candidatus Nanopelagicales bacterium]
MRGVSTCDYQRLSQWRLPRQGLGWLVLITSAVLGSLSHIAFDSFTHGFGWVVQRFAVLRHQVFVLPTAFQDQPIYAYDVLQVAGTVVGTIVTIWCLWEIGRRRMVCSWYPDRPAPKSTSSSRRAVNAGVTLGLALGLGLAAATMRIGGGQDLLIRVAVVTWLGLLVGCLIANPHMEEEGPIDALPKPGSVPPDQTSG